MSKHSLSLNLSNFARFCSSNSFTTKVYFPCLLLVDVFSLLFHSLSFSVVIPCFLNPCNMQLGHTAFDLASAKGHMDVCQELLAHQFM